MRENERMNCQVKKGDFASASAENHYRPNIQLEPIHQIIKLTFNIKESLSNGSVIQRIKANVATSTQLVLNGINFTISEIKSYNESNQPFAIHWHYDGSLITITWDKPWTANEVRDLEIFYEVKKPIAGLYYSFPSADQPLKPTYVGADHETERARYWLPCVDHPSIRTTLEFFLTSDKDYTILANGKLIDEKVTGDLKTAHWNLDFPCPSYLLTICVGDLVSFKDREADAGQGSIPVSYFTTKKYSSDDLKISFDRTPKMLEWMNKKLGVPLPYPKYFQYALPQHGGAMENISLVSWDDFMVMDEILAKEFTWSVDQINVHEMAHSWFGDSVVIKDFAHAWMKESWATYMETVWLEEMVSNEEADYDRFVNERRYKNETKRYVRPIVTNKYDSSWNMFDSHLYPGGSQRIDMLRKLLGDDAFWSGVTDYLQTFQGQVAETSDFQRKLEAHSGLNLQKFFDQWYYSKGYPKLKIDYSYDDKHRLVQLKVKQTQVDKEKEIGLFEFDLDTKIETEEHKFMDYTFKIKDEEHVFYVKTEKAPKSILIDIENKVLIDYDLNPGAEMLKRIYEVGSMKNKILSAFELGKDGSNKNLEFLVDQYKKESFWGIKKELIGAIGSIYLNEASDALVQFLDSEKDPMVLQELIKEIKNTPLTEEKVQKIKNFLTQTEVLYFAHNSCLQLLGSYKGDKTGMLKYLQAYKPEKDKKGILRDGKHQSIGRLRTKEATSYLLNELKNKDKDSRELISIVNAVTDSVTYGEDKEIFLVKEVLVDRIKTETNFQLLKALANALVKFNDPSLNKYLEKIKPKVSFQEQPSIDKLIEKNKGKTQNEELKNLDERLKKLEKENLDLKSKLQKLENIVEKN